MEGGQLDIVEALIDQEKDMVKEELEKMSRTEEEMTTEATTVVVSESSKEKVAKLVNRLSYINKLQQHLQKLNAISAKIPQKTQSIFFKHLPVIVNRSDLEEVSWTRTDTQMQSGQARLFLTPAVLFRLARNTKASNEPPSQSRLPSADSRDVAGSLLTRPSTSGTRAPK